MILSVNSADKVVFLKPAAKRSEVQTNVLPTNENSEILGVPRSYISFKSEENPLKYTDDAKILLNMAREIAEDYKHAEILPQHILYAAITITEENLQQFDNDTLNSGLVKSVSALSKLANIYANTSMLAKNDSRKYFMESLNGLKKDVLTNLETISTADEKVDSPNLSPDLQRMLQEVGKKFNYIDSIKLIGTAMDNLSDNNITYPSDFIKSFISYSSYKNKDEIKLNYMPAYNSRAIEVWNKLALGSNLIATYENSKEAARITASIVQTINQPKYGSFNDKNTLLFVMQDDVRSDVLLSELSEMKSIYPDKNKIIMLNMDHLLINSTSNDADELDFYNTLGQIVGSTDDKLKLILFQSADVFFKLKNEPAFEGIFKDTVTYAIPQIQTYEARSMLSKKMLADVKTPFTKEAKDRAVFHAANLDGIFPDKAVDLMKRISNYYGDSKKKITSKDVDEFAQIGYELFAKKAGKTNIIYDTGKTLDSLYGKETTKKDVEAIIRQIKTGRIGTKGIIITSRDNEAGSGRKYTAETIAGEAKVPFIAIDSADFALSERDSAGTTMDSPKNQMSRIFAEAKNAARQNQYKTAIIYVNNFEEFAFSNPYLPGYKQAMSQLANEMQDAEHEDVSILVIASSDEEYAKYIPKFVRGFNQSLSVDSPAFNKRSRKEILEHRINEVGLPLSYKTLKDKEHLIERLVKLTEYMSFVEIKSLVDKTSQIMYERNKQKASIGEFIEAYLQLVTGRTSRPETPEYNKQLTTSHECGHATNLEVMNDILKRKGQPWHQFRNVNFITLDPRGDFLGAVFEDSSDNTTFPFEALFTALVCSYGGYSSEKFFFNINGSAGISQDLAQATAAAKRGVEYFGFGHNTGQVSNFAKIQSAVYNETVFKDMDIILTNAKMASDLITETYQKFNEWFTQKYSKLIGTDDCMVDGDDFRRLLSNWKKSLSADKKEEIRIMEDMILEIIDSAKKGLKYGQVNIKKAVK